MNRRGFFGAIAAALSTRGLFGRALPQTTGSLLAQPERVSRVVESNQWPRSWTVLEGADTQTFTISKEMLDADSFTRDAGPFLRRMRELRIERELELARSMREDGKTLE